METNEWVVEGNPSISLMEYIMQKHYTNISYYHIRYISITHCYEFCRDVLMSVSSHSCHDDMTLMTSLLLKSYFRPREITRHWRGQNRRFSRQGEKMIIFRQSSKPSSSKTRISRLKKTPRLKPWALRFVHHKRVTIQNNMFSTSASNERRKVSGKGRGFGWKFERLPFLFPTSFIF